VDERLLQQPVDFVDDLDAAGGRVTGDKGGDQVAMQALQRWRKKVRLAYKEGTITEVRPTHSFNFYRFCPELIKRPHVLGGLGKADKSRLNLKEYCSMLHPKLMLYLHHSFLQG
jgi:hypothetical protein